MEKYRLRFIKFTILIILSFSSINGQQLDMVIFGNETSEAEHNISFSNTSSGIGALNESYRQLEGTDVDNSVLSVTMKVDPESKNYLTLKFWGSDKLENSQHLYLYYWETLFGTLGRWAQMGSSGTDNEILNWSNSIIYPNRFVYVTYLLSEDMINGSDTLQFKLAGVKLPIYRAYTHSNSLFEPAEDEEQGSAPEFNSSYPSPNGQTQIEHLHTQLDLAVDRFLTWQYYGEEWDTWVANGWAPEVMTGALITHGVKDSTWTEAEYKETWAKRQNAHVRVQMPIETMALAFHKTWSKYYQDSTLIDRVVKALDFLRIAQGRDGGYVELENKAGEWIGAPYRIDGTGSLLGFGMKGAPGAFLAMQNEIMTDSYMDELINEGDSLTTRRQAYINLFSGFRSYLTYDDNRGHASNQDIVDLTAAYLADQCLMKLDPSLAWSESTRQYYLNVCIGVEDGIYGGPWVSDKGTSLEANGLARGGYETGYGEHNTEHYARLAHLSGEDRVREYLAVHLQALGRMRFLSYDNELRPIVLREGFLGWRNSSPPGVESYFKDIPMAAVLFDDQLCLRGIQLAEEHGAYYKVDYSNYWVHLMAESSKMMRQIDYLEQALDLPKTDVRFPFEEGQPDYAWADEEAALVVIKDNGCQLWATLQWRHPLLNDVRHPNYARTNDKARAHYLTPEYDLMATTAMSSTDGMYSLYIWQFGKYLVLMNASHDTEYEFELPEGSPGSALDLISDSQIDLSSNPIIQPQNTLILEWPEDLIVSSEEAENDLSPATYKLEQNYPNPFNPTTSIKYSISKSGNVRIFIYNILGQKVVTLLDEHKVSGSYSVSFNAKNLTSGVYFYSIQADDFYHTKKMILMK